MIASSESTFWPARESSARHHRVLIVNGQAAGITTANLLRR